MTLLAPSTTVTTSISTSGRTKDAEIPVSLAFPSGFRVLVGRASARRRAGLPLAKPASAVR
jgi:hypothetical protein